MRLVLINHMHPETAHVSGMRSWFFARELAARGHQVVQISEWRDGAGPPCTPEALCARLKNYDWRQPLLVAVESDLGWLQKQIRSKKTSAIRRKTLVLWSYLLHSGVFSDFSRGAQPFLDVLARDFRPQLSWGVFGNTDCWLMSQRLARMSSSRWVGDMKDSWEVFIPKQLQALMARRFQDMAACTANSGFNARVLEHWFPAKPAVVYSGVDDSFVNAVPVPCEDGLFRLTLTGSLYDLQQLERLISAIERWLSRASMAVSIQAELIYAGADNAKARRQLERLRGSMRVIVHPYLALPELAAICRSATLNAYIRSPRCFHHKLLELLSCGRPVLAFPSESDESRRLAVACGGDLRVCADEEELIEALDAVIQENCSSDNRSALEKFTWAAQARTLEQVFQDARGAT